MSITTIRGRQVLDGSIQRADLDTTTVGSAVVAKLIQGTNVALSSTGGDAGTGDVTISMSSGANGANAFTTTVAGSSGSFTVPNVGSTTTVTVNDASWIVVGQLLYFDVAGGGAGQAGALQVTAKVGNLLTLLNPTPPAGYAWAPSTTSFTVPNVGSTTTVTLADASWVVVGQVIYADTAGGGTGLVGALQVTAKAGNVITLLNPVSSSIPASSLSVFIESPSNKTYTIDLDVPEAYTIIKLSIVTVSGTCTVALNRNGTGITGATAVSVSSTLATVTLNQACSVGDTITRVVSSNSSAVDLSAAVRVQP